MSDGMGREFMYLSSHATNRYFIPNWGSDYTSGALVGAAINVGASHCHYLSQSCSDAFGSTSTKLKKSDINACSIYEMKSEDVLNSLNKYCGTYSKWETGNNSYPKLSWIY